MVVVEGHAFHFIWVIVVFLGGLFLINFLGYWFSKRPRKYGNEGHSLARLPEYGFYQSVIRENRKFYFSIEHSEGGSEYAVSVSDLPTVLKIFDDFVAFGKNYTGPLKSGTYTRDVDPLMQTSISYALKQEGLFMPWLLKLRADKLDGMVTISMNDVYGGPTVPLDHFALWVSRLKDFLARNGYASEYNIAIRE